MRQVLVGAVVIAAVSCRSASRGPLVTTCVGQPRVTVNNRTGAPLEISFYSDNTLEAFVGFADVGQSTLPLPQGINNKVVFIAKGSDGRFFGHFVGNSTRNPRLDFVLDCRQKP